jgi:hypothetical protein
MSMQNIFISQQIAKINDIRIETKFYEILKSTFLLPQLKLDKNLLNLFELILSAGDLKCAELIVNNLKKIKIPDSSGHFVVHLASLLLTFSPNFTPYILIWYPKIIEFRSILGKLKYVIGFEKVYSYIFEYLIKINDKYSILILLTTFVHTSPEDLDIIFKFFQNKDISFSNKDNFPFISNIHDILSHYLINDLHLAQIEKSIGILAKLLPEEINLFEALLKSKIVSKINIFYLFYPDKLTHKSRLNELSKLAKYLNKDELYEFFKLMNEVFQYDYIDEIIIYNLFDNMNLSIETIFISVTSQSIFNSILNATPFLQTQRVFERIIQNCVYSNYLTSCFNIQCLENLILAVNHLPANLKYDELRMHLFEILDLEKVKVGDEFYSKIKSNIFKNEKAQIYLNKIILSKVQIPLDFHARIIQSLDNKIKKRYLKNEVLAILDHSKELFYNLLTILIENNQNNFVSFFLSYKNQIFKANGITKRSCKTLTIKAREKLSLKEKVLNFRFLISFFN